MRFLHTIKPVVLASDPLTTASGEFYYNSSSLVLRVWNGTEWFSVSSSARISSSAILSSSAIISSSAVISASAIESDKLDGYHASLTSSSNTVIVRNNLANAAVAGVEFDTTAIQSSASGKLTWNDTDGTLDLGLKGGSTVLHIGQHQVTRVVNKTDENLLRSQYKVVKISSAQGQRLAVALSKANNDANSIDTIGLVSEDIANNQEGFITTSGIVRQINTTGALQGETWADGDPLYLSPFTFGAVTNIKPQAPSHTVVVGFVVYAHQNNGKIFVKVDNGYEIDELHNVRITSPTASQFLIYDASASVWSNANVTITANSVASATIAASANTVTTRVASATLSSSVDWTGVINKPSTIASATISSSAVVAESSITADHSNTASAVDWSGVTNKPSTIASATVAASVDWAGVSNKPSSIASATISSSAIVSSSADNATTLGGQAGSYYLNTSSAAQSKTGALSIFDTLTLSTSNSLSLNIISDNPSDTGITSTVYSTGAGAQKPSAIVARKARGTSASPTALQSGDLIGGILLRGYDGSSFTNSSNAGMYVWAGSNWSPTNYATYITLETTSVNSTTRNERVRIDPSGNVGIGTSTPSSILHIISSASASVTLTVRSASNQSVNIQDWRNAANSVVANVDRFGGFYGAGLGPVNQTGGYISTQNNSHVFITTNSSAIAPLVVQGASAQSTNLQEWRNAATTTVGSISNSGYFNSTAGYVGNRLYINSGINGIYTGLIYTIDNSTIGLGIRASASQTADLQQWQNRAGTVITSITASGHLNSSVIQTNGLNIRRFDNDPSESRTIEIIPQALASGQKIVGWGSGWNSLELVARWSGSGTDNNKILIRNDLAGISIFTASTATYNAPETFRFDGLSRLHIANALSAPSSLSLTSGGILYINNGTLRYFSSSVASAAMQLDALSTNTVPLIITGTASQSANLQEWKNSSGTALARVTASGAIIATSASFGGSPTAPTATAGTSTTQIATTEYVNNALAPMKVLAAQFFV